jgi:hypothetical protein
MEKKTKITVVREKTEANGGVKAVKPAPKKTSKFITKSDNLTTSITPVSKNVILHLKCTMDDLKKYKEVLDPLSNYNPILDEVSENQNFSHSSRRGASDGYQYEPYEPFDANETEMTVRAANEAVGEGIASRRQTDVMTKLKLLKIDYHTKNEKIFYNKKSACFWCSYDFINDPFYIPYQETPQSFQVYGCFCSSQCASAYLFKESIDDSVKFERYHLLNYIYGKGSEYKTNLKCAPNPFYLLNKYYGNLTIEEYRELNCKSLSLAMIEKPMTRFLPELHELNDNVNNTSTGIYKVKRASEMREKTKHDKN